jgi:hypothetical protein
LLFVIAELAENSVLRIQEHNIFNRIAFVDGFFGRSDAERAWNGFKSGK